MLRICNLVIEGGLIFLIIFTPLAFGAVYVWTSTLMELVVLLVFMAWLFKMINLGELRFIKTPLNLPILLFLALILFQLLPFPLSIIKHLSPNTDALYKTTLLGHDQEATETENKREPGQKNNPKPENPNLEPRALSIYTYDTRAEFFKLLAYIGIFFIVVNNIRTKKQANRLIIVIILVGSFEALYGLLEYFSGHQHIFLYPKQWYTDCATGTYINRNHFAGYLEMAIPLAIGLAISQSSDSYPLFSRGSSWRVRLTSLESSVSQNSLLIFAIVVMIVGVIFSRSRMGIFSLLSSLMIMAFLRKSFGGPKRSTWFIQIILLIALLAGTWIGLDPVLARFSGVSKELAAESSRPRIWEDTLQLIKDFPIWGVGLANYIHLFPQYKTIKDQVIYDHAHNDYLEFTAEVGIPGIILMIVAILFSLRKILQRSYRRHDPYVKGITLGGITAILAILFHSITDFNLHIPANALLFSLILALVMVLAYQKARKEGAKRERLLS